MKEAEKLRVLLPHWIDHNDGHEAEWLKWVETARTEGLTAVAEQMNGAVLKMREVNELLKKALEEAGGPAEEPHGHHHHHHHH